MKKISLAVILCLISVITRAQDSIPPYQPYGKVNMQDIEMKACDFEKDANAEVLFDVGTMDSFGRTMTRHVRVKIFNERGENQANIRVLYYSYDVNSIDNVVAETINADNGKIEITPLDKKLIYNQKINKFISAVTFTMPNVKPGSIIEYQYRCYSFSNWFFQSDIPTRYSEIKTVFNLSGGFKYIPYIDQPLIKNSGGAFDAIQDKAMANVHSLPDEPYMGSKPNNLQHMQYLLADLWLNSWPKIGKLILGFKDFGDELNWSLADESTIIKHAKTLTNNDDKIAYVFDWVKNNIKWNGNTSFYVSDGTVKAWNNKTGNSAEINFILYHLLKKSGVKVYPLIVSTKSYGKINPAGPDILGFNNTLVYVPVDTTDVNNPKFYVLDAANKYNLFNVKPQEELNTFCIRLNTDNNDHEPIFIENTDPSMESISLNAEIQPDGKMNGTAEIRNTSYSKTEQASNYQTKGEKKYIDYLANDDNTIKVTSLKLENMDVDTLPLLQNVNFTIDLAGSDGYIYFNPNLFTTMHKNPFLNTIRYNDIDLGYNSNTVINGIFKIPAGYKVDALPQNLTMITPDTSIVFRRMINQQDNTISVRYVVARKKSIYFKKDYANFYDFFKKMYQMLNEQIVLKKS
ncbi:DUF3857 domain-containing protein [Mucilaginibacter sp.]